MTPTISTVWHEMKASFEREEFAGAVALVQHKGEIVLQESIGWAVKVPETERTAMTEDTIFDLASLTKVVATTPAILQLVGNGTLGLDEPVGTYISEYGTEGKKKDVTIRNLLTHTSGFASWRGPYTTGHGIDHYISEFAAHQPEDEPNTAASYSCLGFITLGEVIHRVTGLMIDQYAQRNVWEPLGMHDTMYLPPAELRDRIAATELGNDYEHPMAETVPVAGWRDYLVRGEVHDGNAWYGLGGISGNAGVFGTASDLLKYANMWLNGGELDGVRILPEALVREATKEQTRLRDPNERRGLGWQMVPHPETVEQFASGRGLSEHAYGHTGFTGTSIWIDPDRELISILLTNRVHPTVNMQWGRSRAKISAMLAEAFPIS